MSKYLLLRIRKESIMYRIIEKHEFTDTIRNLRPENFSYGGLNALYDYLMEYEESSTSEIGEEFDPIAICCEFSEYEHIVEFQEAYGEDYKTLKDIEQVTTIIKVGSGNGESFIIQDF